MRFTQNEIEREISDIVPHGLRKGVARTTQIYESVVYGYFNADDERKSPQYQLLQIQAAMDALAPDVGEKHWRKLTAFREAGIAESQPVCVKTATGIVARELADVVAAHCENAGAYAAIDEICEAEAALAKLKQGYFDIVNAEKDAEGQPNTRVNGNRNKTFAKEAVGKWRKR